MISVIIGITHVRHLLVEKNLHCQMQHINVWPALRVMCIEAFFKILR